jgi:hypothetical protein
LLAAGSSPALSCGGFSTGFSVGGVSFVSVDFFAVLSPAACFFVPSSDFSVSSPSADSLAFFFVVVPLDFVAVADFFVPLAVDGFDGESPVFVALAFSVAFSAVVVPEDFALVVDFFAVSPAVFSPAPVVFVLLVDDFAVVDDSVVFFRICAVAGPAINATQMNERKSFTGLVPPGARD